MSCVPGGCVGCVGCVGWLVGPDEGVGVPPCWVPLPGGNVSVALGVGVGEADVSGVGVAVGDCVTGVVVGDVVADGVLVGVVDVGGCVVDWAGAVVGVTDG
jgi:hypothetical protein